MSEEKTQNTNEQKIEVYSRLNYFEFYKSVVQNLESNAKKESVLFRRYSKEQIINFLANPQTNEKAIRDMSNFLYANSPHYRRLCNYFSRLPTLNYTIVPTNLPAKYKKNAFKDTYKQVTELVSKINIKLNAYRVANICMFHDIFCGLYFETEDSFDIVHINPDFTKVTSIEGGNLVFSLDFNYFKSREYLLDSYGDVIKKMYYDYVGTNENGVKKSGDNSLRWQEPPNQMCFKVNNEQLLFTMPPFASIFPDILGLEDYKLLKKTGEILDRYKILVMTIPSENGTPQMDEGMAKKYYQQACNNVDPSVGVILSPMKVDKLDFQNNIGAKTDAVNQAESELWASAGTHGMIFGFGDSPSSSSLDLSVRNDESIAFSIVYQIENWINVYLKKLNLPFGFKVKFLDQSIYTQSKVCDMYQKAATYGVAGAKTMYAASIGLEPSDVMYLQEMEDMFGYAEKWIPLKSSSTQSSKDAGRPMKENVTDSGEQTREDDSNKER